MAEATNIEWCDSTWNPWIGCTRVSPACDDCYAARSTPARVLGVAWGPGEARRRTSDANWRLPLKWQREAAEFHATHGRRRRVFCASLADWLDNEVPIEWLVDLLELIRTTPDLDWLMLSKRVGNWRARIDDAGEVAAIDGKTDLSAWAADWINGRPPANVWIGATVIDQAEADRDVPKLLRVPARVRFLSVEPMLGPIDLQQACLKNCGNGGRCFSIRGTVNERGVIDSSEGGITVECICSRLHGIEWVICGGESGPQARPMHPDWARHLRDQCAAAGVAFTLKQWGEWAEQDGDKPTRTFRMDTDVGETLASRCDGFISLAGEFVRSMDDATTDDPYRGMVRIGKKAAGRMLDGRTHDEWPEVRA